METEKEKEKTEPILTETLGRFTLFPIQYHDIWQFYKKQEASLWQVEEINFQADLDTWIKLSNDEQFFIEHILAFFAGADGIVLENLMTNFTKEIQIPEARAFYAVQAYNEQIHSHTYSELINTYIKDEKRKNELFTAIENIPAVKEKAEWALKYMKPSKVSFAERLIAFIVVEGVFFSASFCAIFWLKNKGLMTKALGLSNEWIARDEGLHASFGVCLYHHLINKVPQDKVHKLFASAVAIERKFITKSLPCKLIGMNSALMYKYIKFVADYWLTQLGYEKLYNVKNPFDFMNMISLDGKTNFFDRNVSEYQKSFSINAASDREMVLDREF